MAKQIFLSYGREQEVQSFVIRLKRDLESNGFTVWLDIEDIPAGSDWHAAIGCGLHNCKGLIAVITNKYLTSRYCTSELYTADSDRKSIFPVILEDVNFQQSEKSMGVKYVISGINWSFFRPDVDNYDGSLSKLIQGMSEHGIGPNAAEDVDSIASKISHLQISPGQHGTPGMPQVVATVTPPYPASPSQPNQTTPNSAVSYSHQPHAFVPPSPPQPYYQPYPPVMAHNPQYPAATSPSHHYPPSNPLYPPTTPSNPLYPPTTPSNPLYPPDTSLQQPMPSYPTYPPLPQLQTSPPTAAPSSPYAMPPYNPGYSPQYPPMGYGPPQGYVVPHTADGVNPVPPSYTELFPQASPQDQKPTATAPPPPKVLAKDRFRVGLKLEALDRRFPYYVCVATVMDRKDDGQVRVHFDGWGEEYDYWCDSDDIELHPVGWCSKHKYEFQPTRGIEWQGWNKYLTDTQSEGADNSYFNEVQLATPGSLHFRPGMRLEAKDRLNPELLCVATISKIADGKLLIHFDGWSNRYDYWCSPDSTDIHPAMWSGKHQKNVQPPKGHAGQFRWSRYLSHPDINPAPAHIFTQAQLEFPRKVSGLFEVGMKLEAKDRANPSLICVATITNVNGDQLLIHFDGWSESYDYWCQKDTVDIHPIGWSRHHNYVLQKPYHYHGGIFSWDSYLAETGAKAVPQNAFTQAQKK